MLRNLKISMLITCFEVYVYQGANLGTYLISCNCLKSAYIIYL